MSFRSNFHITNVTIFLTFFFLLLSISPAHSTVSKRGMPQLHLEKECMNGGVGYDGKCLCPEFVNGERCERPDLCEDIVHGEYTMNHPFTNEAVEVYTNQCEIAPALVCCWRNRLLNQNLDVTTTDPATRIKNLLEFYGPWTPNDRLMLDYFFGEKGTEGKYTTASPTQPPEILLEDVSIAFVIMIHSDYEVRLPNLMAQIYSTKHTYMIHVDRLVEADSWTWITNFVNDYNTKYDTVNIHLVHNRFHGAWGSISLVYLELASMMELLRIGDETQGGGKWTHVINLSAFDFPLKPLRYIEEFLYKQKQSNFIESLSQAELRPVRQQEIHLSCGRSVLLSSILTNFTSDNVCPMGSTNWMYKHRPEWVYGEGAQWHILTREFVEYMVSSLNTIELLFSMKYSFIPDEAYFQTALLSSPFASTLVNYNYRFLPWADQLHVMEKHVQCLRETDALFVRKLIDPEMGPIIERDVINYQTYTVSV